MAQVVPGDIERPGAGRQQAAEHAEGSRLASTVGAQQAEDFPALHGEADPLYSNEVAEAAIHVVHLDDGFPVRCFVFSPGHGLDCLVFRPCCLEAGDEGILEARRHRFDRGALCRGLELCRYLCGGLCRHHTHRFAVDERVDDAG